MKTFRSIYNYLTKTTVVFIYHPKPKKPDPPQRGRQQSQIEFPFSFKLYDFFIKLNNAYNQFREKYLYTKEQLAHYTWKKNIQRQKGEYEDHVIDI